jgi:hypothetical protein
VTDGLNSQQAGRAGKQPRRFVDTRAAMTFNRANNNHLPG